MRGLRLGTRGSQLALVQAGLARERLRAGGLEVEVVVVQTTGDRSSQPLARLGGVGAFVKEIEEALAAGEIDLAVHSLKDLPTVLPAGLEVAAVLERADPRDALITRSGGGLETLPPGALVATSSPRRQAQLRAVREDLRFTAIRGNVDTRLRKLAQGGAEALVLALAGLVRLGLEGRVSEVLEPAIMLPAPGQGAIALEVRAGSEAAALVAVLDHRETRIAVEAERAFLLALGGGCSLPVAALGVASDGGLSLDGMVADPATGDRVRERLTVGCESSPYEVGRDLARQVRGSGGDRILFRLPAARPLAGRRVLVTRAGDQAGELTTRLAELGAVVVGCATIAIAPPEDEAPLEAAVRGVDGFDWVAFTSANAASAFAAALAREGREPASVRISLAAVGPATAQALRAAGLEAALTATSSSGAGLAAALADRVGPGARVLVPRAREALPHLTERLRAAGVEVVEVEAYRTLAPPDLHGELERAVASGDFEVVTFLSPSAVANLTAAAAGYPQLRARLFGAAVIACIGPTTAAAARERGLGPIVQAERSSIDHLVGAIVRWALEQG